MERVASEARGIAVLTGGKGRGSNLRAIHQYFQEQGFPAHIRLVIGDRQGSAVEELCASLGLRYLFSSSQDMPAFEERLAATLADYKVELLALAGFLKLLSADFLSNIQIPVLNIHPALIPHYCGKGMYGMKVHEAVFANAETHSGVTIHKVDGIYDHGAIIAQEKIDISDCASPQEMAARVLAVEHRLYAPTILQVLAERET